MRQICYFFNHLLQRHCFILCH